jgi:hypothetical protein
MYVIYSYLHVRPRITSLNISNMVFKPPNILWATVQSEALYSQAQGFHYVQNAFEKCDIHDDLTLSRSLGSLLHFG